jgi:hypothetical protein
MAPGQAVSLYQISNHRDGEFGAGVIWVVGPQTHYSLLFRSGGSFVVHVKCVKEFQC